MILIEGPDGAGKTTLAHELARGFSLTLAAHGDRKELYKHTRANTYNALGAAVRGYDPVLIYDRLYYSELVYGPLMRDEVAFSATERDFIEAVFEALQCPMILCLPPFEVVKANVEKSDQLVGVAKNIEHIYDQYQSEAHRFTWMTYDYTDDDLEEIEDQISVYLKERRERTWH